MRMSGLIAAVLIAGSVCKLDAAFYVSPHGEDADPGSRQRPFATLEAARDAIRRMKADGTMPAEGLRVFLRGGIYRRSRAFELGPQDSGAPGAPIIYRAFEAERPILSGGEVITGWQPDGDGRWKADVKHLSDFRQLYVNGTRAGRARGGRLPGVTLYGDGAPLPSVDGGAPDGGYRVTDATMARWGNAGDIELIYFYPQWAHQIVKVHDIRPDQAGGAIVRLQRNRLWSESGNLTHHGRIVQGRFPDFIANALELLDEPGEWYLDRSVQVVYYRPRPGEDMTKVKVTAPQLEKLLEVNGTLDQPVHHVQFAGIAFAHAGWLRPNEMGHPDIQANFTPPEPRDPKRSAHGEHDKSPANVRLHAARSIRFDDCTFTKLGSAGIDIEYGSQDNVISGCHIHDISGSAIQIGDVVRQDHHPDDDRRIVKNNHVINNTIHHAGLDYFGSIGVFAGYTDGTVIAHNEISHLPYSGISVGWGWGNPDAGGRESTMPKHVYATPTTCRNNRIEYNHIHHVMQRGHDGGGVYTLGNQAGTIIRGNHIHDNRYHFGGIYLDEGSGFIEVTGNVVSEVRTALMFNNRRQNRDATCNVHDNYFRRRPSPTLRHEPGKFGRALAGAISVAHSPDFEPQELTVETWLYLSDYPSGREPRRWIVGKNRNEYVDGHYALVIWGKKVSAYLNIGGGAENHYEATSNDLLFLDRWQHLALTYDGSVLRLYCDGEAARSLVVNRKRVGGDGPLAFGKRPDNWVTLDNGRIDEVRIYDRALSEREIRMRFEEPGKMVVGQKKLLGHWGFEQDLETLETAEPLAVERRSDSGFDKNMTPLEVEKAIAGIVAKAGVEPSFRRHRSGE